MDQTEQQSSLIVEHLDLEAINNHSSQILLGVGAQFEAGDEGREARRR